MAASPEKLNTWLVLNRAFHGYRRFLAILVVLGIVSAALDGIGINALVPLLSFITHASGSAQVDSITAAISWFFGVLRIPFSFRFVLVFAAGLFLVRAFVLALFAYLRAKIVASFMTKESGHLMGAVLRAKWRFLVREKTGDLMNTAFWDVRRDGVLLDAVAQLIQSFTGFIIYLLVAVNLSPSITLVTLVAGAVLVLGSQSLIRKTRALGGEAARIEKSVVQTFGEYLGGVKVVKASGVVDEIARRAHALITRFERVFVENAFVQSLGTVFIQPFSLIFVLVLFAFAQKQPSFELAAFAATLYLIQKIFTYLQTAQGGLYTIAQYVPYAANIARYKDTLAREAEEKTAGTAPFSFSKQLTFERVSLSYGEGAPALKDVSFALPHGSFTGIIGPSGAGKTSVADLILRLFHPDAGVISIDGTPIERIALSDWREHVGYVAQDPFLINGTLKENIRFFRTELSDDALVIAAKQAHIHDFIAGLPEGYDTPVADRGATLSGGQRQRIALARALAGTPRILVLDEATSALDAASEQAVQQALEGLRGKMTVVAIAHRISTVMRADQLLVLRHGRVVEAGSPEALRSNPHSYFSTASLRP